MKKIITLFSVLVLALSSCQSNSKRLTFFVTDYEYETIYDDSNFLLDNKEYHEEIALMSYASAMASMNGGKDYEIRSKHLVELWKKEKFNDIYISDSYYVKPTLDSVGYGIASKVIDDFNLVTVTIRSGGYDAEWGSNLALGADGNASGFQNSANIVLEDLAKYIQEKNITGHTKFWFNGYSRGGSIANIMAGTILEEIDNGSFIEGLSTTENDVYAYCFEPPNGVSLPLETVRSDLYKGIHNLVNFNDLVPMVYPSNWELYKYGQNHYYSDRVTDINFDAKERRKMVSDYHFSKNAHVLPEYKVDDWKFFDPGRSMEDEYIYPRESIHPSLGRFGQTFIKLLTSFNFDRVWYSYLEESLRNIVAAIYGYNEEIEGIEVSDSLFFDILFSYSFLQNFFAKVLEGDYLGFAGDIESFFYILFKSNKDNVDAIKSLYENILYLIIMSFPALSYRPDISHQLFSRDNILMLSSTHTAELNYSFLRSSDTRIKGNDACKLNDGSYYILHIENPTSISIFEKTLNKKVFTYENEKMSSDILSAEKFNNGNINIYMPKNGQYEYVIEADLISLIDVNEYNMETEINGSMPKSGLF